MKNPDQSDDPFLERARELHRRVPLIDGHNDLPWQYRQKARSVLSEIDLSRPQPELHTDIARLREGGVGGQFWSVYVPVEAPRERLVRETIEQIDLVHAMVDRYPETFQLALTADDVERAFNDGKIASLIGVEGGHSIDCSLGTLRMFHRLGARYMTLAHFGNTPWADSATDTPVANGLTEFGLEVVREMNRLGVLVDLSHVSPGTMRDALGVAEAPVIFSHSSARAITDHPRNVPDNVLKRLPENGGVVMVSFVPFFVSQASSDHFNRRQAEAERLGISRWDASNEATRRLADWEEANPAPRATIANVADHIDHIVGQIGVDHVGIGSDFDGIPSEPEGLEDVSKYPLLTAELVRREYSDDDIMKILGLNVLRALRGAEDASRRLQQVRGPSEAQFEDLDGPPAGDN